MIANKYLVCENIYTFGNIFKSFTFTSFNTVKHKIITPLS